MIIDKKIIIIVFILLVIIVPVNAQDTNTWYINQTDFNGDGSQNNPFNNLDSALEASLDNYTIILGTGVYSDLKYNITTNNLKIIGENSILNNASISIYGENIQIKGLIFTNSTNTAIKSYTPNLVIQDSIFKDNAGEYGGAIYNHGNLNLFNCEFTNNTGEYGGAIYNQNNIIINKTIFKNNTGRLYGGVIYNRNTANIIDSEFTNNTVTGYGATIYNYRNMKITNTIFIENNALGFGYGGAIHNSGILNINTSNFTKNKGYYGGVIDNDNILTINNCKFNENIANQSAGAIDNDGELNITNTIFINNTAGYHAYGGAIFNRGNLTINNANFTNNTADNSGGAIYIGRGKLNTTTISFTQNTANIGGAIYIQDSQTHLTNLNFNNNTSKIANNIYTQNSNITIKNIDKNSIYNTNSTINIIKDNINVENLKKSINSNKNLTGIVDTKTNVSIEITITRLSTKQNKTYTLVTNEDGVFNLPINLAKGEYTALIKYNNEYVEVNISILSTNTILNTNDMYKNSSIPMNFTGKLETLDENILPGQNVEIKLVRLSNNLSKTYTSVTDYNGFLNLPINLAKGEYLVYCTYKGYDEYESCKTQNCLIVY